MARDRSSRVCRPDRAISSALAGDLSVASSTVCIVEKKRSGFREKENEQGEKEEEAYKKKVD